MLVSNDRRESRLRLAGVSGLSEIRYSTVLRRMGRREFDCSLVGNTALFLYHGGDEEKSDKSLILDVLSVSFDAIINQIGVYRIGRGFRRNGDTDSKHGKEYRNVTYEGTAGNV